MISQPVEVARFLMQNGLSLREAHEILDRISAGERVPVPLRSDNAEAIASELKQLRVSALVLKNPEQ